MLPLDSKETGFKKLVIEIIRIFISAHVLYEQQEECSFCYAGARGFLILGSTHLQEALNKSVMRGHAASQTDHGSCKKMSIRNLNLASSSQMTQRTSLHLIARLQRRGSTRRAGLHRAERCDEIDIKRTKFVTITHGHFCNTKLSVMRKNASQPHFIRDFPSVSAIQGEVVMLKKFVMQNLQLSDCDKLFSLRRCGYPCNSAAGVAYADWSWASVEAHRRRSCSTPRPAKTGVWPLCIAKVSYSSYKCITNLPSMRNKICNADLP